MCSIAICFLLGAIMVIGLRDARPQEGQGARTLSDLARWLRIEAKRQIEGCRRLARDGVTQCFTPDGAGRYGALWTRDFCYMVEGYAEGISNADLRNAVGYLLRGVRRDGVAPDRVQADGQAVYSAGSTENPVGEAPTDNAQFLVKLVEFTVNRTGNVEVFTKHAATLKKAMRSIPRREDGLVFIDPDAPSRSPYGFTDCIRKTGAVLFSSVLYWESAHCMARLYEKVGSGPDALRWRREAKRVRDALRALWDEKEGVFLAATQDCRQPDVWGSAYAVFTEAATEQQGWAIARWLDKHYGEIVWQGMVRHIREPEGWQSLLRPLPANTYQNGGYWPVPGAWVIHTLRRVNPQRASQMLLDLLQHMHEHGVNEWENKNGAVGVRNYVASATLTLIAVREEEQRSKTAQ